MKMMSRRAVIAGLLAAGAMPQMLMAEPRPKPRPDAMRAGGTVAQADLPGVDELIAKADLDAAIAFVALDAASGAVLAARGADLAFAPASTLKSVTALYAQATLGADYRFSTRVIRAGDLLVLAGGGDPELDSDGLAELAKAVAEAEKASGRPAPARFAVWGGALPRIAEISPGQAVHLTYNPSISGMILNFNRVHLGWRRGEGGYALTLEARGRKQSPRAYTVAAGVADRTQPLFTYDGTGDKESWTIARQAMGKAGSRWLPVRKPELYAGDAFQTLCRAQGLVLPAPEVIADLPAGEEIASRPSRPLRAILRDMMEYSNNLTAEIVGLAASGRPDLVQSGAAMTDWLRAQGVTGEYSFRDHSGLSPATRITARMMAETMAGPGRRQDLRGLMKRIPLRDAKGKARKDSSILVDAKTGTLNFVSNLAGYAEDGGGNAQGRQLVFAVLTADEARRAANEGRELPDGVIGWTRRSKALQQGLIENWLAELDRKSGVKPPSGLPAQAPSGASTPAPFGQPEGLPGSAPLVSEDAVTGAG